MYQFSSDWAGSFFDELLSEEIAENESEGLIVYWYGVNMETETIVWFSHDPSSGTRLAALGYAW